MFTEKVNKIALNANDDKRPQTFYWEISYPYGTGPGIMCKAELMRYPLKKKWKEWLTMMKFQEKINKNRILNLITQQPYSDKIFLYVKDPSERKYLLLITKNEDVGQRHYEPQGLHWVLGRYEWCLQDY